MDFSFTEEQQTVRELAREILEKETPLDRIKAVEASEEAIDHELWAQLAHANLLGVAIPEEYGGMGMGLLELCVLLEEAGRRVAPVPLLETLALGALSITRHGSAAQRARWLPEVATGRAILAPALQDAHASSFAEPATDARRESGGWVLRGAKRFVPAARTAARLLVPARTESGAALFLVDPEGPGLRLRGARVSTGAQLFELELEGAPAERLGEDETCAASLAWLEALALVGTAALQVGVSDEALRITARYVSEREQFGVPIGSFQAVQHRAADGFIDLEALRWCMWRAADRLQAGLPALREARVAKYWAANAGSRIANACIHLHGGMGSDTDYPIHRYFLWSRALELQLGAATPQLVALGRDLASRGLEATP